MEDILEKSNADFVASLGPTLAYLVLLMVLGLVGNTLVFLVYYKRFEPSSARTYILVLSVCDLLNNCVAIPSDIYEMQFYYDFHDIPGCKAFGFFTMCVSLLESLILVAIALARHRKICQLRAQLRTSRKVYVELICLGVFALCLAIPFGVLKGLKTIPVYNSTINGTTCAIDDKYVGSLFLTVYYMSLNLALIICIAIMCVCYALIARHLYLHKRRLLLNAKNRQKQSSEPQMEIHECAEDKRTVRLFDSQPDNSTSVLTSTRTGDEEKSSVSMGKLLMSSANNSANVVGGECCEDKEDEATPAQVQVIITDCVEQNHVMDMDQTGGTVPSPLNSVPERKTSSQQTSTGDITMEDITTQNTSGSGTAQTNFPDHLKENAVNAEAYRSEEDSSTVCKAKLHRRKHPGGKGGVKKLPTRTTLMLFVMTAMFILSNLPYHIVTALFRGQDVVGDTLWERNLHQIALKSYFLNSAVNPLVYSFCSVRFRRECYLLLSWQ